MLHSSLGRLQGMVVLLAAVLACVGAGAAEGRPEHQIMQNTPKIELLTSAGVLDDPSGSMTPQDVAAAAQRGEMRYISKESMRYVGYGATRAVWIKFELSADSSAPRDWLLEVSRSDINLVRLYVSSPGGAWTGPPEIGGALPFSARPIPHRNFILPVQIPAGGTTLLLRLQNDTQAQIQATLWQPKAFYDHDIAFFSLVWFYSGIFGSMLFYNLLLYVMVRDRGYMLYVGCIAASWLSDFANTGLATQFIWGDQTWWSGRFVGICWSATVFFRIALTRHFLSTRERLPGADKALEVVGWLALGNILACIFLPRTIPAFMLFATGIGSSLLIDGIAILGVIRRWPGAPYYCASWLVMSAGILVAFARFFGVLPPNVVFTNILPLTAALSFILLSIALAHQINEEKQQKEQAQAQALAIVRASQVLSSETRLDRLHVRMREIMATLTGATAVRFVLWDADLKAWFLYDAQAGGRLPVQEAAARGLLPITALHHVGLTREPLIVTSALADKRFADDPALAGTAHCSLMALPIMRHEEVQAVVILEDRGARSGFSPALMDTLASIAGPMAVALENVLLYERLEQRVADQTRELRDAQRELVATARRAGMAEVAINVLHNVGNTLNSVNVTAELMRARIVESKASGLARAVDLLDAHEPDLGAFMRDDPKGRMLPLYFRELADELVRERDELLIRARELTANVDHIKSIVAAQQNLAGSARP